MKRDEARDEALIAALSEAAREVAAACAVGPAPAAWHRLQEARARPRAGILRRRWLPAAALVVLGSVGGLVGVLAARRARPLTYVVEGGEVEANGYVRSVGSAGTELRFSDGTRVRLDRGARLSVGAASARGAGLRVEDGQAHFEVVHRPGAAWSVEAGPYRVQVTGTVFDVDWQGATESATIRLRTGSVRVTGPHLAAPVALEAGQRLIARLATGEVRLEGIDEKDGIDAPPRLVDSPPRVPPLVTPPVYAPARRRAPPPFEPAAWPGRIARGEAAAVIAEARTRSLDTVLAGVDGPALAALADAARYSGEPALSERALRELRRRFPTSAQAPKAAFLLGRMADDRGDRSAALSLYRQCRAEAPRGPYAAEAVGREMLVVERLSGREAATSIARQYLEHYPEGTYLLQARAILGLP
jgi:ferric-dicitrate binding protein FerR (iron transport regulator)